MLLGGFPLTCLNKNAEYHWELGASRYWANFVPTVVRYCSMTLSCICNCDNCVCVISVLVSTIELWCIGSLDLIFLVNG